MSKAKHLRKLVGKSYPFAMVKVLVPKIGDAEKTELPAGGIAEIIELFGDDYIIEFAVEDNSLVGGLRYDTTIAKPNELEFVKKLMKG